MLGYLKIICILKINLNRFEKSSYWFRGGNDWLVDFIIDFRCELNENRDIWRLRGGRLIKKI